MVEVGRFCSKCGTALEMIKKEAVESVATTAEIAGDKPTVAQTESAAFKAANQTSDPGLGYAGGAAPGAAAASTTPRPLPVVEFVDVTPVAAKAVNTKILAAGIGALAAVIILGVVIFSFASSLGPLVATQRALSNFEDELSTRLQTTPLHAVELLMENIFDGTTSVDFDMRNAWGDRYRGEFTLMSDSQNTRSLLRGEMGFDRETVDFEIFVTDQVAMARTSLLGRDFYGIRYSTFRDDFSPFARTLGLDNRTRDSIVDFVESIEETINASNNRNATNEFQEYIDVLTAFIRNSEYSSTRENGVRRVEFAFEEHDIFDLLRELLHVFENDDQFISMFDVNSETRDMHRQMIREMNDIIRDGERNVRGDVTLVLYIGSRNRLNRAELSLDLRLDGERLRFSLDMDFGESATDRWSFSATVIDSGMRETFSVVWNIRETGDRYSHTIALSGGGDEVELRSDWNSRTGAFTLSIADSAPWGINASIDGTFRPDGNRGFTMSFESDRNSRTDWRFDISSRGEHNISVPSNFINIDEWGTRLIDDLERAVSDFLWGW